MFEQSRDPCWVQVLRVLFAAVPAADEQTVVALLEQIFAQSALLALQVTALPGLSLISLSL
jgi:hypothetical protein